MRVDDVVDLRTRWIKQMLHPEVAGIVSRQLTRGAGVVNADGMAPHLMQKNEQMFLKAFAHVIRNGDVFVVRDQITPLLSEAARQLPKQTTIRREMLPASFGIVIFENGLKVGNTKNWRVRRGFENVPDGLEISLGSIFWWVAYEQDHEDPKSAPYAMLFGCFLFSVETFALQPIPQGFFRYRFGQTWDPETWESKGETGGTDMDLGLEKSTGMLFALLLFIEQEILTAHPERASRAARRRLGKVPHVSLEARVVKLRRARAPGGPEHGDGVEWSCRWLVRGHWRNQFYSSDQSHRPIWITPHVKGPDGLPLKPQVDRIFSVER